ncbi:MAG: hypothetical protein ACOX19_03605 [Fermentimonas sp.]|jgi:hypothetical protein
MKPKTLLIILLVAVAITECDRKQVNTPPMFAGEEFDQGEKAIITGKISNRDVYPHVRWLEIKLLDFGGTCAELNKQISAFRNKYLGRYLQPYELSYMEFKAAAKK